MKLTKLILIIILVALCSSCKSSSNSTDENQTVQNEEVTTTPIQNQSLKSCGQVDGPLKIMPLGDSITESKEGYNSYRRALWHNLTSVGCFVDFVGSRKGVSNGHRNSPQIMPPISDFDIDHEGHWDYRADEILEFVPIWTARYKPKIVLLHLGTNDIFQGQSIESTISDLMLIIESIRIEKPDATILLAKVIPSERNTEDLVTLNKSIETLANSLNNKTSRVLVVDHETGYKQSDNSDGIHPNENGEIKVADNWFNGIMQVIAEAN